MSAVESDQRSGLRALFAPRSVALIGASADPVSNSARPLRLLRQHGFAGDLYPVNPKYTELEGLRVYSAIAEVPTQVDLSLIAVPASSVARVLEECAAADVRCGVVMTSGFAESGPAGVQLQQHIKDRIAHGRMRVCGPHSDGIYVPASALCGSFTSAVDAELGY